MALCECGCGQPTTIFCGEPRRFIHGHNMQRRPVRPPVEEDRGHETPCLVWQGGVDPGGYGRLTVGGRWRCAHRLIYEYVHGPVGGLEVDHLCRVTACVRLEHLEAVTHAENMRRGRNVRLTLGDVRRIRESSEPQSQLARRFGVSQSQISRVRAGVRWKEVGDGSRATESAASCGG